ncbi:CRISPR-associated protein TM1802 (cas_TM1802) [Campylobacter sputorum subsp. bubulus]|uniref:CRISPR-associated protein TM1802 (Cas_TM1802) n=1 Tax=Campylobacter sputorum subsp. sputorum TaxID=32024 RepID=A0A381DH04_9BACT|nr:TM1802 family CRISPR-associated protein [Campylobacter sputorum]ASM35024.1 CRISPR/Cas system-associated protein Cas8, type I-B/HMARI [Campylobacter sputorum aubsp. sputorum RM3237]KAB0581845.1 CRISPR-associated protein [Campylobacter sputorum subsp. sputorum]QEL05215.1 CRISPR/Cas system-associated protein Cas8, type I-B [Campylobacter sputorum subsp. sputorum]SUX09660.1 CRISPR-associated protein TM1802 (cas_TM1802) [Campylobacter sputorum subsp. sputorum]SUX30711.1 CRISPR-associated protein
MSDITKTFYDIGSVYKSDEAIIKNDAYKYSKIKTYLVDIESKEIIPSLNVSKDDLIITRFGVGSNSGNLFPNQFFDKNTHLNLDKFIKGILTACKNLLSKFSDGFDDVDCDQYKILTILKSIDEEFFKDKIDAISKLEEYKEKGEKTATYLALSYKQKPISSYFQDTYISHISKTEDLNIYGYDMIENSKGIGGDANLAFCSVNELPTNLQYVKPRLLPLNPENAQIVKIGYDTMDKKLSHNFYGLRMAILPTFLTNDENISKEILEILEKTTNGDINSIKDGEEKIDLTLENSGLSLKDYPVLATILFYEKINAAVNLFLVIDDILPSYITHIAKNLAKYKIKAFSSKKDPKDIIYLQKLFNDNLEIMQILLTDKIIKLDILLTKLSNLIVFGSNNKTYFNNVEWDKYFNDYYNNRSIERIEKYINFFNDIGKIKFNLRKDVDVENLSLDEKLNSLIANSSFLQNPNLKSAYLLGMLSAATINWQFGVSKKSSYANWLNNIGVINRSSLEKIYKKCDETIRKVSSTSGTISGTEKINLIKDKLFETLPEAVTSSEIVKSSHITIAFAMGGSDFNKHIKDKKGENDA